MIRLYDEIEQLINDELKESPRAFTAGAFTGKGWHFFHYACSTYEGPYPKIALKRQKHSVNVYVMTDEVGFLDDYVAIFGKTGVGKGCLRIKKLTSDRREALIEIVRKIDTKKESQT